jgi:hypothetical protein
MHMSKQNHVCISKKRTDSMAQNSFCVSYMSFLMKNKSLSLVQNQSETCITSPGRKIAISTTLHARSQMHPTVGDSGRNRLARADRIAVVCADTMALFAQTRWRCSRRHDGVVRADTMALFAQIEYRLFAQASRLQFNDFNHVSSYDTFIHAYIYPAISYVYHPTLQ